jgi:Fe2+ or Zn2+ uptake regulation protein
MHSDRQGAESARILADLKTLLGWGTILSTSKNPQNKLNAADKIAEIQPGKEPILDRALAVLKDAGYRYTRQRIDLLRVLIADKSPATIETLHERVGVNNFDLVTLYRSMLTFEQMGLVYRTFEHRGTARFSIALAGRAVYVQRRDTNELTKLDDEDSQALTRLTDRIAAKLKDQGLEAVDYSVQFYAGPSPVPTPRKRRKKA